MALPAQAIEKLSDSPVQTPGAYSQLIFLGGALFALSIVLYIGLSYGYLPYLNNQTMNLQAQIAAFAHQIPQDRQDRAVRFYSQLYNIKNLLATHSAATPFFSWLEKNTSGGVYIVKAAVNTTTGQAVITANAKSMAEAVAQVKAFEAQPEVSRALLTSIARTQDGQWQINLTLYLASGVFRYTP